MPPQSGGIGIKVNVGDGSVQRKIEKCGRSQISATLSVRQEQKAPTCERNV